MTVNHDGLIFCISQLVANFYDCGCCPACFDCKVMNKEMYGHPGNYDDCVKFIIEDFLDGKV